MKVLLTFDVFSGCAWYRCVIPGYAAQQAGAQVRLRQMEFTPADLEWCDTFVMQRTYGPDALRAVKDAKALGKLVVYDIDDDLWSIEPSNESYAFWQIHAAEAAEVMAACDRVTTTTERFATLLRTMHPDVRVIPNAVLPDFGDVPKPKHRGIVVGWAGSRSHIADIEAMAPVLTEVLDAHPNVTLALVGDGVDKWMQHKQLKCFHSVHVERYAHALANFDIGIAPIEDNAFNRCKSDLKVLEYAHLGIPCVASRVGPYLDTPALLARNASEWKQHLTRLITEQGMRDKVAKRMKAWARTTDDTLPLWLEAWTK